MDDPNKAALRNAAVIAIFFATFVPAMFGTSGVDGMSEDPWRRFVSEFQTLITGTLAIAAATWTIGQMQKSDAESERRHRELINLALRPDMLAVDRGLKHKAFNLLEYRAREIKSARSALLEMPTEPVERTEAAKHIAEFLREQIAYVREALDYPPFREVQRLFDGRMLWRLNEVEKHLVRLEEYCAKLEGVPQDRLSTSPPALCAIALQDLVDGAQGFAAQYGIKI